MARTIKVTGLKSFNVGVQIERTVQGDNAILWIFDPEINGNGAACAWFTKDELNQFIADAQVIAAQLP